VAYYSLTNLSAYEELARPLSAMALESTIRKHLALFSGEALVVKCLAKLAERLAISIR
jgi:hypothetical protein